MWKKENKELVELKPYDFIKLDDSSLAEKMKSLRKHLKPYWKNIDNPDEYVASLRA